MKISACLDSDADDHLELHEDLSSVVDLNLYRRQRKLAKNLVSSRVPLYVSHLEGQVTPPRDNLVTRMASVEAQIEELDDLIYLLNQDEYFV
ncbi:MAG: hypothetical protein OXC40_06210 [Proteobacteria bacterium]|nr:hypothetical protein [Pseudomonadota bacterium]